MARYTLLMFFACLAIVNTAEREKKKLKFYEEKVSVYNCLFTLQ